MPVAGLDLARRSDHSALVILDVGPDRLTVRAALRLPQAPLRQQFSLIAPHLAGLDLLVFDQGGLGDAAAELLPKTPPHVGVCLIAGDRPLTRSACGDRLVIGKSLLIQRLGAAMRSEELMVAEHAPGRELLRQPGHRSGARRAGGRPRKCQRGVFEEASTGNVTPPLRTPRAEHRGCRLPTPSRWSMPRGSY
jgi:hypothetical protein